MSTSETTTTLAELVEGLAAAAPGLDVQDQRLALALLRAVAEGVPVPSSELAARTGRSESEVDRVLGGLPGVHRDGDGAVVGFWGLANVEMPPHEYLVRGRRLSAWCAWDPFILTDWLGGEAVVRSRDADSGEPLGFRIEAGRPMELTHEGLVLSFGQVEKWDQDVLASFCHFVHYFTDEDRARGWAASHPDTFVLSLGDAVQLGHAWGRTVFPDLATDA